MSKCVQPLAFAWMVFLAATLIVSTQASAVIVFTADGAPISADALTPPHNRTAVLFVHGHDPNPDPQHPNYRKNFQDAIDGLTSFKIALDLTENICLGVEPYYLHFGDAEADHQRSIDEDAAQIQEAVDLILARQRLRDPHNPHLKLAIIAYSKGTISTRKYLKQLHAAGAPIPVSEFIAIAPPNHGLNWPGLSGQSGYPSARQLNNGHGPGPWCNPFGDSTLNYIENLNGHPINDTKLPPGAGPTEAAAIYATEAPGSRPNGTGVDQGTLYVTIYAANDGDFVGGSSLSSDCQGRVVAKNLAPDAVNLDDIVIPAEPASLAIPDWLEPLLNPETRDKFARHQNTVHHPEVIFRSLYTVVHHQTPPPGESYSLVGNVPVIPVSEAGPPGAAVALVFDNSGSMAWSHDGTPDVETPRQRISLARQAAIPFLDMLQFFSPCRALFGIARFPSQPFQGCFGEVIAPLAAVRPETISAAIDTAIPALTAAGGTPLLAGLGTATGILEGGEPKALVLLSDGFHNCPVGTSLDDIAPALDALVANSIRTYAIGFGQPGEVPNDILQLLALQTQGGYFDVTTASGFDPAAWDPATALQAVYKSVLVDALQLDAAADPTGRISPGERKVHQFLISDLDRKVAVFVSWTGPLKERPAIAIRASDGAEIAYRQSPAGVTFLEGETFTLIKFDPIFLKQPGKVSPQPWSLELAMGKGDIGRRPTLYQWSVVADSRLSFKPAIEMKAARTGAALTLTARLSQTGGPPVLPATVWARVARPLQAVGNWLAAFAVPPEELSRVPEKRGEEALSPLLRKIIYLTEFRKQPFARRAAVDSVRLYDDGTHGDAAAGDGVYTGRFEATTVAGTYVFDFNVSGRTASGVPFERNQRLEKHIGIKADVIGAEVIRLPADGKDFDLFEIVLRPADSFGNLLGPGRKHLILWEANAGEFGDAVVDHLDGTYSRRLRLPAGTQPDAAELNFIIGDTPFRLNLGKELQPERPATAGWLILFLFFLTLLLVRMIRAQRG